MNSIKVCEYSRSRSFHDDLILQDQASGERSQDHWSSGIPIILKLYRCLHHTLKMCMWFGYNPQINLFLTLFCKLNLVVFQYFDNESEWTVGALCSQLLLQFLIQMLLKLYRCLDDALKICMCFGYNPQVNF